MTNVSEHVQMLVSKLHLHHTINKQPSNSESMYNFIQKCNDHSIRQYYAELQTASCEQQKVSTPLYLLPSSPAQVASYPFIL